MYTNENFETYAKLLRELCREHRDVQPWHDRADLPQAVREFWSAVGVSQLTRGDAPAASAEEDEKRLAAQFETWFEDAATRDRWKLEAADEPLPRRRLPVKPRLVDHEDDRMLIASDGDDIPSLHVFRQSGPAATKLPFDYLRWCMDHLVDSGTHENSTDVFWGPKLNLTPIWPENAPISVVADGIHVVHDPPTGEESFGATLVYRDIKTYTEFVLSRDAEEHKFFRAPKGRLISVTLPKKLLLDPSGSKFEAEFTLIPAHDASRLAWTLAGKLDDVWVWVQFEEKRRVGVICEEAEQAAVRKSLEARGCTFVESRKTTRALSSKW
ncbi:MAG: hypothetical protein ACOY0T_12155 [Myxococcota bacterium]